MQKKSPSARKATWWAKKWAIVSVLAASQASMLKAARYAKRITPSMVILGAKGLHWNQRTTPLAISTIW